MPVDSLDAPAAVARRSTLLSSPATMLPPNLAALRRQLESTSQGRSDAQAALLKELADLDDPAASLAFDPAPPSRSIGPGVYLGKHETTTETPIPSRSLGPGVNKNAPQACVACQRPLP